MVKLWFTRGVAFTLGGVAAAVLIVLVIGIVGGIGKAIEDRMNENHIDRESGDKKK